MHCLVQYVEDKILHIVPTKSLTEIEENKLYWAPYKRLGFYEAIPICYDDDRLNLEIRKKNLQKVRGQAFELGDDCIKNSTKTDAINTNNKKENIKKTAYNSNLRTTDKKGHINESRIIRNRTRTEMITEAAKKEKAKDGEKTRNNKENIVKHTGYNLNLRKTDEKGHTKESSIIRNKTRTETITEAAKKEKAKDGEKTRNNKENIVKHTGYNLNLRTTDEKGHTKESSIIKNKTRTKMITEAAKKEKAKEAEKTRNKENIVKHTEFDLLETEEEDTSIIEVNIHHDSAQTHAANSVEKNIYSIEKDNLTKLEKTSHKQHSCYFCKKILYQIPRHWFSIHFKEPEVKEIMLLNANNPYRIQKMNELRKKGDFEYNKHACNAKIIVTRESNSKNAKYLPCPTCLGYFSKDNLRHHRKRCSPHKGDRCLQGNSKKLTNYIHERASQTLRNHIAPSMYQDEVSNHFLFDEIIILYGNYLCIKYTDSHLKNYIRAQLRLLGRFMMQAKLYDPNIQSCKDLMHPSHIDTIRKSIDDVAGLDKDSGIYKHPTNARTLNTELRKILEVVQSECDKKENDHLMKLTKALSRLYKLELAPYINRICKLSENKYKRSKRDTILPENNEIEEYLAYLLRKISLYCRSLKVKYFFSDWNKLCQYILVALVVFNRKRPGETQRIELDDFYKRECVSQKDMEILSDEEKLQADKYVRVAFRGKLGNTTALLIDKIQILPAIETMIKYRLRAGVHPNNRFLFAYPSKDEHKTYHAYRCHRHLLEDSGMNSESLTFTNLRKQFATEVAKCAPTHQDELRISNYMSHDYNIHKRIYDQSTSLIDITKVSKHLEASARDKHKEIKENKNTTHKDLKEKCIKKVKKSLKRKYDEYLPTSSFEEEDIDPMEVERCLGKFKRRKLWSSEEKRAARVYFKDELTQKNSVDKVKIKKFKEKYSNLFMNRSVSMIKQWLEGEIVRVELKEKNIHVIRPRYSTPERELLERSTERHSLDGSEPSLQELQDLVDTHDIFKRRSAHSLLQKYRHILNEKNKDGQE